MVRGAEVLIQASKVKSNDDEEEEEEQSDVLYMNLKVIDLK